MKRKIHAERLVCVSVATMVAVARATLLHYTYIACVVFI